MKVSAGREMHRGSLHQLMSGRFYYKQHERARDIPDNTNEGFVHEGTQRSQITQI